MAGSPELGVGGLFESHKTRNGMALLTKPPLVDQTFWVSLVHYNEMNCIDHLKPKIIHIQLLMEGFYNINMNCGIVFNSLFWSASFMDEEEGGMRARSSPQPVNH